MKQLKSIIPTPIKSLVWRSQQLFRLYTGHLRSLPDFIIIGGQRCGTTTLYSYLSQHPNIAPPSVKEVHYFDLSYQKGTVWYRTHFPLRLLQSSETITGEASPYYLFHPHVPKRVAELLPSVRLIVLLRNPVERAYSQYHHEVRWGFETAPTFAEAIEKEEQRLPPEVAKLLADENYYSFSHHHHSYLARGIYIDQLQRWEQYFPADQILILNSEQFYQHTATTFKQITDFLGLPRWDPQHYKIYNQANNPKIEPDMRKWLVNYFAPYNEKLYHHLKTDFGWH